MRSNLKPIEIWLVSCSNEKMSEPAAAQDLYCSTYFKLNRKFVEAKGGRWFIMSAKLGLVAPEDTVEPYDLQLKKPSLEWGDRVISGLIATAGRIQARGLKIYSLGGKAYSESLKLSVRASVEAGIYPPRLIEIEEPCQGMMNGNRQKWLKEQTDILNGAH